MVIPRLAAGGAGREERRKRTAVRRPWRMSDLGLLIAGIDHLETLQAAVRVEGTCTTD